MRMNESIPFKNEFANFNLSFLWKLNLSWLHRTKVSEREQIEKETLLQNFYQSYKESQSVRPKKEKILRFPNFFEKDLRNTSYRQTD